MKFFITGATGFVGSHLTQTLIEQGHEVYSLVRNESKALKYPFIKMIIKGSLNSKEEPIWIENLPDDLHIVIHTAGVVHSHYSDVFYQINDRATRLLFDGLKAKYQKKIHFIFISSLSSCGPSTKSKSVDESSKQNPPSDYGKSKLNAEKYLLQNLPESWRLTIIRPPMVIGPRDPAILDIFKMIEKGFVIYPGRQGREKSYSFVCVFDLVNVIIQSALTPNTQKNSSIYFASFPKDIIFDDLINMIANVMNKKKLRYIGIPDSLIKLTGNFLSFSAKIFPNELRLTKDKAHELLPDAWTCDSSKSVKELNIKYQWPLDKTIQVTYDDYRKDGLLK